MSLKIIPVLCNAGYMDNYSYILADEATGLSAIVDAAEEKAVVEECKKQNIVPSFILVTHHHDDHTAANEALKKIFDLQVIGSEIEQDKISGLTIPFKDGEKFILGESEAVMISAPGHTDGHCLWYFAKDKALFTGDVLFNLCIGGLFEGTPKQMWHSLQKIKNLPDDTRFYPGHEYTNASIEYLLTHKDREVFAHYLNFLAQCRMENRPPVGNTLFLEKSCNPYLSVDSEDKFISFMS